MPEFSHSLAPIAVAHRPLSLLSGGRLSARRSLGFHGFWSKAVIGDGYKVLKLAVSAEMGKTSLIDSMRTTPSVIIEL